MITRHIVVKQRIIPVARKGRARKTGPRKPCGRLVQATPDQRLDASKQPHRVNLPEQHRMSEKAESALGRYNLLGIITPEEYRAGQLYARDAAAYHRLWDMPKMDPGSIAGFAEPKGGARHPLTTEEGRRIRDRYDASFEAIPRRCQFAVKEVAVIGRDIEASEVSYLKMGLSTLVPHYGLTAARKSAQRAK